MIRFSNLLLAASSLLLVGSMARGELESLDDGTLSATVGGSGLSLATDLKLAASTTTGAAFSLNDKDGFTNFTTAADLNLRYFGVTGAAVFNTTVDAADRQQTNAANSAPLLGVGISFPATFTISFLKNWPSSGVLGVGVLDICTHAGTPGSCAAASAGDYPVLMAPPAGVNFTLTNGGGLQLVLLAGAASGNHLLTLMDTAASTLTINGSATASPNFALVDPGNVPTANTHVSGAGFTKMTVSGLDFGTAMATATTMDLCLAAASTNCPVASTNGQNGLLVKIGSTALGSVSVVATGVTVGDVGTSTANNGVGLVGLTNLSLSNTSVMVYAH